MNRYSPFIYPMCQIYHPWSQDPAARHCATWRGSCRQGRRRPKALQRKCCRPWQRPAKAVAPVFSMFEVMAER